MQIPSGVFGKEYYGLITFYHPHHPCLIEWMIIKEEISWVFLYGCISKLYEIMIAEMWCNLLTLIVPDNRIHLGYVEYAYDSIS